MTMLGVPYAYGKDRHLSINLITRSFGKRDALAAKIGIEILILFLSVFVMIAGGSMVTANSAGQISPALHLPIYCHGSLRRGGHLRDNKIVILLIINLILLIVGTFMDMAPALLIFTPIFLPVVKNLGMEPIQFGIMMSMNLAIGTITPPVGSVLFVGCSVAHLPVEDVIKQLLPYFLAIVAGLLLVTFVPAFSMWLPGVLGLL